MVVHEVPALPPGMKLSVTVRAEMKAVVAAVDAMEARDMDNAECLVVSCAPSTLRNDIVDHKVDIGVSYLLQALLPVGLTPQQHMAHGLTATQLRSPSQTRRFAPARGTRERGHPQPAAGGLTQATAGA